MHRSLLTFALALAPLACGDPEPEPFLGDDEFVRDPALDVELVSARGDDISHAVGDNCMRCHQENGPGPGRFTVAGTLHDADGAPAPDGLVELRTAPDGAGDLVLAIEVDARGNFYSTEPLAFPDTALFPTVYSGDGARKNHMPFPTSSGACNVCHAGGFGVRLPEA
ncbi:hypothetical protein [Nannocystis pusilla]|uniref:Carboxypeptidase regulatory-like domain-containing protein n=1 Tax=Nannocystis pusilla TaxID=889268 RepID=A0ABS7U3B4_9BACT|nr:hypothetical protein [Nannocystis pusilla]MBZ5715032.1 hypothetical protein [Nannocystis pusilla]